MPSASASDQANIYQRPVELLQNLIRFDTSNPPGNEAECIKYINGLLSAADCETTILAKAPNRPNLVVRLKGRGDAPPLLLYGHVDVQITTGQTWQHPPFEGKIVDGYVWGRGTLDMKSAVAMMLAAFLKAKAEGLRPAGDVVLAILADEEQFSDFGARYLVENHAELFKGIRYALGELGGFSMYVGQKKFYPIQVAEKQICTMQIVVRGSGGHGSMPFRGGAMAKLARVLKQLDGRRLPVHVTPVVRQMIHTMAAAFPFPTNLFLRQLLNQRLTDSMLDLLGERGRTFDPLFHNTVNPTIVHGGKNVNVIPSEILLTLDGRLLPGFGPDDMLVELCQVVASEVEVEVVRYDPGPAEPNMGLFSALSDVLREADPAGLPVPTLLPAVTDGRFFSKLGIQTYGFTPMKLPADLGFMHTIHAADERIPVEALDFGTNAIYRVLQRFE